MIIEFHAREYASAAEMMAAAAERRRRLFNTRPVRRPEEAARIREILVNLDTRPEWKKRITYFNAHVIDYAPFRPSPFQKWRNLIAMMAADHGFTYDEIVSKSRNKRHVFVRHEIWFEMRRKGMTFPFIGGIFDRDHTVVLHGVQCAMARRGDEDAIAWVNRKARRVQAAHIEKRQKRKAANGEQA